MIRRVPLGQSSVCWNAAIPPVVSDNVVMMSSMRSLVEVVVVVVSHGSYAYAIPCFKSSPVPKGQVFGSENML